MDKVKDRFHLEHPRRTVEIQVNGRRVQVPEGATVHAALLGLGHLSLRRTLKTGEPRGVFCGMGVCYECLVTIDGRPGQRACQNLVKEGMEIRFHEE